MFLQLALFIFLSTDIEKFDLNIALTFNSHERLIYLQRESVFIVAFYPSLLLINTHGHVCVPHLFWFSLKIDFDGTEY
jgi:hypothetical protein